MSIYCSVYRHLSTLKSKSFMETIVFLHNTFACVCAFMWMSIYEFLSWVPRRLYLIPMELNADVELCLNLNPECTPNHDRSRNVLVFNTISCYANKVDYQRRPFHVVDCRDFKITPFFDKWTEKISAASKLPIFIYIHTCKILSIYLSIYLSN